MKHNVEIQFLPLIFVEVGVVNSGTFVTEGWKMTMRIIDKRGRVNGWTCGWWVTILDGREGVGDGWGWAGVDGRIYIYMDG